MLSLKKIEVDKPDDVVIIDGDNKTDNDDTETVDGILDDIERLNSDTEYTLFE